ncbi:MAG: hypothetical protein HY320_14400, partial [Armatimonadetes bacterium]|nr:hypothetical protein [Armatimonadota bacterium]
ADHVRALTRGGGVIRFGALPAASVEISDAKGIYAETYLRATFDAETLAPLRQALARGAGFLFDGLFGVGSMAMRRYLDTLLPGAWQAGVHLLNECVDPRIGGIAKPDPSDPQTLVLSGAIDFLTRHPNVLISVTADMDADRIGKAVLIPADRVARARELGLFVTEFPADHGSVWALRFTANQAFTLIAYDRLLSAAERFLGVREPKEVRRRLLRGDLAPRQLHLITSIATSVIAGQLARRYGVRFHLTAVGFKNLGWLAREIDARRAGDVILCLMEESGGAQIGPFQPWNERGDTIHRDKDTCALALALFCVAGREHCQGRSLLDLYEEMASQLGGLAYFERIDAYLPNQPVAEDPARVAEAEAAKQRVLARLSALREEENQGRLLELFGYSLGDAERLPTTCHEGVTLLARQADGWHPEHPQVTAYRFPDGSRLEWFAGGAKPEDGMRIDVLGADGNPRHWCVVRASGTEALLRVYLEIVEPIDAPRPQRLVEVLTPLLRYLHLDEYALQTGGPSYLEAFEAAVRDKYLGG